MIINIFLKAGLIIHSDVQRLSQTFCNRMGLLEDRFVGNFSYGWRRSMDASSKMSSTVEPTADGGLVFEHC